MGVINVEIYLVKRQQRREGVIKSKKWADIVYGWPLILITLREPIDALETLIKF